MEFHQLVLPGCFEIRLDPHGDERGYFMRTFDRNLFREHGLVTDWVQENQSLTIRKWTIRGLHFQRPPHTETKLVRSIYGVALDVFVDLRKGSPTFGRWDAVELSAEKFNLAYIPWGFAHGFCSLTEQTIIGYHVDACYAPDAEGGLRWNDPALNICWPPVAPLVSPKDNALPLLRDFDSPFNFFNVISNLEKECNHAG